MQLYDGESPVYWASIGLKTKQEMEGIPQLEQMLSRPSVLYDDGLGMVYDWRLLSVLCGEWGVQITEDAEADFEALQNAMAAPRPKVYDTDPAIMALAKMEVAGLDLTQATETVIAEIHTLMPDWEPDGHDYKQGDAFEWDGKTWRVSQDTTSQSIYPPGMSEALYYEIVIAPDGIIVYRPAKGQYDSVRLGERRHYPNADSPVYESLVDWNAYSPDTAPANWKLVG